MANLTLHQKRTNEGPDGYKIFSEVTVATDMPTEVFVHHSETEEFSHVATPLDFYWPTAKDIAKPYYRLASSTKYFSSVNVALDYVAMISRRVNDLVLMVNTQSGTFEGEDTTAYPLPTP